VLRCRVLGCHVLTRDGSGNLQGQQRWLLPFLL
jgi:hypothetical protein